MGMEVLLQILLREWHILKPAKEIKTMAKISFTAAAKHFFGFREGKGLTDFAAELKQLTIEDKLEIAEGLRQNGIDCEDPVPSLS